MRRWIILCTLCLLSLIFPCAELLCWDTSGNRIGSWSETSCDGYNYAGTWTGYVTNDCRFIGTNDWESVIGAIDPNTKILTATGTIPDECGSIKIIGTFTSDLILVSGSYKYSKSGGGSFSGTIQP